MSLDLDDSLRCRVEHNEWGLQNHCVCGILVVYPFEYWVHAPPGGPPYTTLAQIRAEFAPLTVYSFLQGQIVSLAGSVTAGVIYPEPCRPASLARQPPQPGSSRYPAACVRSRDPVGDEPLTTVGRSTGSEAGQVHGESADCLCWDKSERVPDRREDAGPVLVWRVVG